MRARNLKPGFFENEILGTLNPITHLLFAGLFLMADREGRLEERPLRIKAMIFPYRDGIDINGELTVLERSGFITRYESDGVRFIEIVNFKKHQNPHHTEKKSNIPPPGGSPIVHGESREPNGEYPADSLIHDSLIPDSSTPSKSAPDIPSPVTENASPLEVVTTTNHFFKSMMMQPGFNEVRDYIIQRLPHLKRQNATEINEWIAGGADPEKDIFPSVDFVISIKGSDIGSFRYFTRSIMSNIEIRKEASEMYKRMEESYAG